MDLSTIIGWFWSYFTGPGYITNILFVGFVGFVVSVVAAGAVSMRRNRKKPVTRIKHPLDPAFPLSSSISFKGQQTQETSPTRISLSDLEGAQRPPQQREQDFRDFPPSIDYDRLVAAARGNGEDDGSAVKKELEHMNTYLRYAKLEVKELERKKKIEQQISLLEGELGSVNESITHCEKVKIEQRELVNMQLGVIPKQRKSTVPMISQAPTPDSFVPNGLAPTMGIMAATPVRQVGEPQNLVKEREGENHNHDHEGAEKEREAAAVQKVRTNENSPSNPKSRKKRKESVLVFNEEGQLDKSKSKGPAAEEIAKMEEEKEAPAENPYAPNLMEELGTSEEEVSPAKRAMDGVQMEENADKKEQDEVSEPSNSRKRRKGSGFRSSVSIDELPIAGRRD